MPVGRTSGDGEAHLLVFSITTVLMRCLVRQRNTQSNHVTRPHPFHPFHVFPPAIPLCLPLECKDPRIQILSLTG